MNETGLQRNLRAMLVLQTIEKDHSTTDGVVLTVKNFTHSASQCTIWKNSRIWKRKREGKRRNGARRGRRRFTMKQYEQMVLGHPL